MRKILVPTDFSENAMNAIIYAMELFKYDRSDFLVVHAYADEVYENTIEMDREFFEEYREKAGEAVDHQLQKVVTSMLERSPNPKHNYEYLSVFDSLVDAANDLADSHDIDVIVMGTKGKTNDRDITFGSRTLQVIKYVKCPVLVVPQKYHDSPPERILFPTDYLIPYKRREIKLVSTIAKNFCASLNFLYISKSENLSHRQIDNRSFLQTSCAQSQVTYMNVDDGAIEGVVNRIIQEHQIQLLVMVNSRHSYMESLLYRSTIERIGLKIEIPFLVLQNLPR